MSVVNFRPHTIRYRVQGQSQGYVNEIGDYVPAKITFSEPYKCNAVPNGGKATIRNAEGDVIEYSFTIYASSLMKDFEFGELVRIDRCGIIYELTVKGFHRYKGLVKIWV